jgi:hypothetical protein
MAASLSIQGILDMFPDDILKISDLLSVVLDAGVLYCNIALFCTNITVNLSEKENNSA